MKRHIVRSCRRGVAFLLAAVMCLTMAAGVAPEQPEQLEQPELVEQMEQTQPSTTIQEIEASIETLNTASVSDLVVPVTGETPVAVEALTVAGGSKYTLTSISWADAVGTSVNDSFAAETVYTATIVLTAAAGCKFQALTPTVNDGTAAAGTISDDAEQNTLTFTVTFPATGAAPLDPPPSTGKIEDTDTKWVTFSTGDLEWKPYITESVTYTNAVGATATVQFSGTKLALYGHKAGNGPIMSVTIDGEAKGDVDFYGGAKNVEVWKIAGLEDKAHTAVFTFTGRRNAAAAPESQYDNMQVAIDCFEVGDGNPDPPAPTGDYVKDYEDGNAGTWAGATAAVVADPDNANNKVLKLVMNGFAVDNAAPKITDGTLSMKVRADSFENFGLLYRAKETANVDKIANQFVNSPTTWYPCYEGTDGAGSYVSYPNTAELQSLPANEWVDIKLQFRGNDVEIAVGETRYGVFEVPTSAKLLATPGVFGFRAWRSARTVYIDDVLFTTEMLDMGTLYEEPPIEIPRIEFDENYTTDAPNWAGGVGGEGIVTVTVPTGGTALNNAATAMTYGLTTWRLTTEATGGFGVAFNATQDSFNAIYTAGDGTYVLRLPDGTTKNIAVGGTPLASATAVKVQVMHVGNVCTLYVNGVEVGSVTDDKISAALGTSGLYNPRDASAEVKVSTHAGYELFFYENDFSDAAKLGGWNVGTPTKTEDDKLQLTLNVNDNAIAMDTPIITDGVYEFDFTANAAGAGRAGFLFRSYEQDYQSMFYDIGSNWFWLNGSAYGAVPVGMELEPDREYHVKLTVNGTAVAMEMDESLIYSGNVSSLSPAPGRFGFRKQFAKGVFTVDNLKISELCDIRPDDVEEVPETITAGGLTVTMDEVFPRVIKYEMDEKTLLGNQGKAYGIILNGKTYYPMVTAKKAGDDTLNYTLTIPTLKVSVKVSYKVEDKQLKMNVTEITEGGDFLVTSLGFEDGVLLSTKGGDATASHASVETGGGWFQVKDHIYDSMSGIPNGALGSAGRGYAMLSSGGLAGTVNNSGIEAADKLSVRLYKDETNVVGTIGDGTLPVRTPLEVQERSAPRLPWSTVAICGDYNEDGSVNWQDAAANYYNIRSKIFGMDTMKENMMYITMNFASQVQQPFLRTLDLGKSIYNYTDGFGQMVMHKGYAAEGHDDSHADYGGHVGVRQGGAADFNYAINEGAKYNMLYGIHMNVSEHNPDALYFSPENMTRPLSANWGWIDQAYWVDEKKDILSGNRKENLDRLKATLPNLAFTYIDIYGSSTWMAEDLVKNLNERGFIAGTEFGGAMEMGAAFTHWGNDRAYPNHGNNSTILRFVKNDLNVFVTNGLFNSSNMPLVGSWSNHNNIKDVSLSFFNNVLPTKYLQHFPVLKITDITVKFSDGVMTQKKAVPQNAGKFIVEMTKDNKLLATWEWVDLDPSAKDDPHAWAASDTGDAVVFIPWYGEDSVTKNPDEADKIYHWNAKGGTTTWDVPAEWLADSVAAADVYQLSGDNKEKIGTVDIEAGKITLTAEAETGYVLYPAGAPAPTVARNFGEGSGMVNPGFELTDLTGWNVDETKGATAAVIKANDNAGGNINIGETRLQISGDEDQSASLSQPITGLTGGKDYTLYLFTNVGETGRLDVSVTAGGQVYTGQALPTTLRHFDQSKYFPAYDDNGVVSPPYDNFQKVAVPFSVPAGAATATLTITGTLGSNGSAVFADDVTLFDAMVQNHPQAGKGEYENYVLYEDFENVEQGLGAFTYCAYLPAGNTHLAEYREEHDQFTDYVLNGNYSMKMNEFNRLGETLRSRPGLLKLEPNTTYEIGFQYETGIDDAYQIQVVRPDGTVVYSKTLKAVQLNTTGVKVDESFTTGDYSDAYLRVNQLLTPNGIKNNAGVVVQPLPPLAAGLTRPEGSTMEYVYISLDDVYIRTPGTDPDPNPGYTPPSNTTTKTETNADGSKTTTVTDKKTGTVTETTTMPNGDKVVVETKKDGSMTSAETRKDGTTVESATTAEGKTTATVTMSDKADKVTVTISTPEKPKPGEVAVIVKADGTREVVKNSVATEKGMRVTLPEGAMLELADNSKGFADVKADAWFSDAVAFASSRELFKGTGNSAFSPNEAMTRGMFLTVLYRFDGGTESGAGATWYSTAQEWAMKAELSDGSGIEANVTREQLVTLLYRYAGKTMTADKTRDEADEPQFIDGASVSAYAAEAMDWAVSLGILTGKDGGKLDPQGSASRAEVAAILERFVTNLG